LIPAGDAFKLILEYSLITLVLSALVKAVIKDPSRSFIMAFFIVFYIFLFGAIKKPLENFEPLSFLGTYRFFLPLTCILLLVLFMKMRKGGKDYRRLSKYLTLLVIILFAYESANLLYNYIFNNKNVDFGDGDHSLIADKPADLHAIKPDVYWIIMDEYSASSTLKKKWNFNNPLDSLLRSKNFFVADSATSPYNFTHYSMGATFDMMYLARYNNKDAVRYKDMVLGDRSLYENNTVEMFRRNDYAVTNYTMFDMKDMATHPFILFRSAPSRLISSNTLMGMIEKEVAWNFQHMFYFDKKSADSLTWRKRFARFAGQQHELIHVYKKAVEQVKLTDSPKFLMLQYMLTHEPFVFNADGTLHDRASFTNADAYIPSIQFANKVIVDLCDHIREQNKNRNYIIILQSDHGFKFDEKDPLFNEESCRILFAVYSSDNNYSEWKNDIAGVNVFRILFNKYFNTTFPLLPAKTHILLYRE
jgi:hypothetical protein